MAARPMNSNLFAHLNNTLESLKMKRDDIVNAARKVNKDVDDIIDIITKSDLTKRHPLFRSIEKMSTGSYYEKVKISQPNEFDIMLKIEFDSKHIIELNNIDEGGAFYTLAFKSRIPEDMKKYIDKDGNIQAKHILDDFRGLVKKALEQSGTCTNNPMLASASSITVNFTSGSSASLKRKDSSSPAVTLNIRNKPENISVDLVIALQIQQWPNKANNGMKIDKWLGTKRKQELRSKPCYMVAKQANLGKTDEEVTWRISFSNIEKDIMIDHGSKETCCGSQGHKCCRKKCLKLMKYLLEQFKEHGDREKMNEFCSYHAKTALLHACTHYPKDEYWKLEDLDVCFNRYVEFFQGSLEECFLPNFFIPSHNLFSSVYIKAASCKYLSNNLHYQKVNNYPIF